MNIALTIMLIECLVLVHEQERLGHGQLEFQFILTMFQLRDALLMVGFITHLIDRDTVEKRKRGSPQLTVGLFH